MGAGKREVTIRRGAFSGRHLQSSDTTHHPTARAAPPGRLRAWWLAGLLVLAAAGVLLTTAPWPAGASGHLSPAPGSTPTLDWLHNAPLADLDQAAADTELTLVVTAGSQGQTVRNVGFGSDTVVDADKDGDSDLRAQLTVDTSQNPPEVTLLTERIDEGGHATDVEVLALVPYDRFTDESTPERPNLVVGYRTVASGGGTGGILPAAEAIEFQIDQVSGLTHNLTITYNTEAADNPLRFLTGHFDGTDASGVVNADLVSARPSPTSTGSDPVPSTVAVSLSVDASDLGDDPVHGSATLSWQATDTVPVDFDYLESETPPSGTPEVNTKVLARDMPDDTTEILRLDETGGSTGEQAVVEHRANQSMDALTVRHTRSDGTRVDAGLQSLPAEMDVGLTAEGVIDLSLPVGGRVDVVLEAALADHGGAPDGRALFAEGDFSHELDHVYAAITDAPGLRVTPRFGNDTGVLVELDGTSAPAPPEVRFLAADDLANPRLPADWSVGGHPGSWGGLPTGQAKVGVVDDHTAGSSLAAWFGNVAALDLTLDPQTLADTVSLTSATDQQLEADLTLTDQAPMAGGIATEAQCDLAVPAGVANVDVQPPDTYGWSLDGPMSRAVCDGSRGQTGFELDASGIPAETSATIDFSQTAKGSLAVSTEDASGRRSGVGIDDLFLQVRNEVDGLTGPDLLGAPVTFAVFHAAGLPGSDVSWSTDGGQTSVDVLVRDDIVLENHIEELDFRLRTDRPLEPLSGTPTASLDGTSHRDVHYLQAVQHGTTRWIGGGAHSVKELHADTTDSDTSTNLDGRFVAAHPAVLHLETAPDGPFTNGWSLDASCAVGPVPAADISVEVSPPEQLRLSSPAHGPGFGALDCDDAAGSVKGAQVTRASDGLDVDVEIDGDGLPPNLSFDLTPDTSASINTGQDAIGFLRAALEDESGTGLPDSSALFDHPLHAAAVRFDDAVSATASWRRAPTEVTVSPDDGRSRVGSVQAQLRTGGAPDTLGDVAGTTPHELSVFERDGDGSYEGRLTATAADVSQATLRLTDSPRRLHTQLSAASTRPLVFDVDTGFGGVILPGFHVDVKGQLLDLPTSSTFDSDLTGHHELSSSTSATINEVKLRGTVRDDPSVTEGIGVNAVLTGVPVDVVVDVPGTSVTTSRSIGSVDALLTDPRDGGLFSGVHRLRLTLEDVPGDLALDPGGLSAPTVTAPDAGGTRQVLNGTATLTQNAASGPVGRVAVELTSNGDGFFDTPYKYLRVDLDRVPTSWTVEYRHDPSTDEVAAAVRAGSGSLGSAEVQVTRKKGGATAVSDVIDTFAQRGGTLLSRSAFSAEIDDRTFPETIRRRLDDLYQDAVSLATTTRTRRPVPWPEPGASPGPDLTVPAQDHALLLETGDGEPELVSARISDVQGAEVGLDGTERRVTVDRASGNRSSFFVGTRERKRTAHDDPSDPLTAPSPPAGAPAAEDDEWSYDEARSGALRYPVLANDEPDSGADGDALDESTLRVVEGPSNGTANVAKGKIDYTADDGHRGPDQLRYEICDNDGDCAQAILTVVTREFYRSYTLGELADLPDRLTVTVDGRTVPPEDDDGQPSWKAEHVTYDADAPLGRVDLWTGPLSPTKWAQPRLLRAIAYDAPDHVSADVTEPEVPGVVDVDTSDVTDVVVATERADERTAFGFRGEDVEIGPNTEGWLKDPSGPLPWGCKLPQFGWCAQLYYAGYELDATGDQTGATAEGFFVNYERRSNPRSLSPSGPSPSSSEFVPKWTFRYTDIGTILAGAELRLLPLKPWASPLPFLRVKVGAAASNVPGLDLDLWANGDKNVCFTVPKGIRPALRWLVGRISGMSYPSDHEFCVSLGTPDYVNGKPWHLIPMLSGSTFDPYGGTLPPSGSTLGSGLIRFGAPFVDPQHLFAAALLNPPPAGLQSSGRTASARTPSAVPDDAVRVTELAPGEVDAPLRGEPRLALRLEGEEATLSAGVLVDVDLDRLGTTSGPVCAVHVRPDGEAGTTRCLDPEQLERADIAGDLRVTVDRPGTLVVVDQEGLDATAVRAAGPTRIETAVQAARYGWSTAPTVLLATARNYPDALAAAPLAGALDAPILLTEPDHLPAPVAEMLTHLDARRVLVLGGSQAISEDVARTLRGAPLDLEVERIGGTDRVDTARRLAAEARQRTTPDDPSLAFVASARSFADALAASPVAARRGQPIYLSEPSGLADATAAAMRDAGVERVHLVGGTAALAPQVAADLEAAGIEVVGRLAGQTRYGTARAVADWAVSTGGELGEVLVATGERFPDSLTGGALGGRFGRAVLLADPEGGADQPAAGFLSQHAGAVHRVAVIGGSVSVPPETAEALRAAAAG